MTQTVLWLSNGPTTGIEAVTDQLGAEGYVLHRPDLLLPLCHRQAAHYALIEWEGGGETAQKQVQTLRQHQPACHLLVMLPLHRPTVLRGVLLNATGYLAFPFCPTELVRCLSQIRAGNGYWHSGLLALLTNLTSAGPVYPTGLNRREHELWGHLANGLKNQQLEDRMCLSTSSVKNLKTSLAQKLSLPNARQLIELAVQWGKMMNDHQQG